MQKISFKVVNSSLTQEQTKTVNRIQALLSRCENETKKIFENSKQKRSCHWLSSLRQCQNVLELCLGELCGMLASTGFASVGDTINLLQLVQKTNFEYLLKGYMLLFKRWESNAETNIEVKPHTTRAPIGIKHFAKDELKTVNSLQFYKQQKELEKKRPKILLRNSKTVANLAMIDGKLGLSELKPIQEQQNQANQEDLSSDSEEEGGNKIQKIQNSIESGFVLLQKIRQEDQEFIRNVDAVLNKKKAVPESKMPLVMNHLDELLQTYGDANEDFEMMDETLGQQLQQMQKLIKEAKTIKTEETAEFHLDFSPRGLEDEFNENGTGIDEIREDENKEKHKDIAKLKEDIRTKNDTILDLKASLKEKDALIKEIEMQNKHYIFLSTQLRIDLKGLKMVFDEESDKLVQERQKKNDAEAKLAVFEQTTGANNNDNIRLIVEKMALEVENNHLSERILVLENEIAPKVRKVAKVMKGKVVGKVPQGLNKEKNAIDAFIEKEDMKTEVLQVQKSSSKIENDPLLSYLSKELDQSQPQPQPEKARTVDNSPIIQQAYQQRDFSQVVEPKQLFPAGDSSHLELKVSKSMQARNSLVDFKNVMQTQEEMEARIEQARKVTEENLKRTLIKGFAPKNIFKQRERSMEMRRPQVLTSREKEKYMLHRNASYGVIGIEDNLTTGNFTERDNSKSRELPQINFSTTAGNDDSIQMQRAADTKAMLDSLLPSVDRKEKALVDKNYWGMVLRDPLRKSYKAHRTQSNDMYDTHLRPLDYSELSGYPQSHSSRWERELNVQSFSKLHGQSTAKWQLTEEDEVELPVNKGNVTADPGKPVIIDLGHQREREVRDLYECLNQNAENVQVFILWIKEVARLREDGDNVLTRLEAEVEFIQSLKTFGQFREFYIKCIESHQDCGRDCAHVIRFRERIKVMISNKIKIKHKDKEKEKKKKKVHK